MSGGVTLHLLRHGEPEGAGRLLGHGEAAPLPEGIALCLRRVEALRIDALVSSDLTRARAAAEAIGAGRGLGCRLDPRWRELHFGAWDGVDPASLPEGALAAFHAEPDVHAPPGGETWSALCGRVGEALAGTNLAGDTLVVTHAGAIRAALAVLLGLDYRQTWAVALPYGALVSLRLWPGKPPLAQITGLAA